MQYFQMYKCGLCGELFAGGEIVEADSEDDLSTYLDKRMAFHVYDFVPEISGVNSYVDKLYHKCENGSVGIAQFVGLRPMSEEDLIVLQHMKEEVSQNEES